MHLVQYSPYRDGPGKVYYHYYDKTCTRWVPQSTTHDQICCGSMTINTQARRA